MQHDVNVCRVLVGDFMQKACAAAVDDIEAEEGEAMATEQAKHMAELFASVSERTSTSGLDLATIRDISERLHVCGTEPAGVSYAEVDADGVHAL